jgi:excisionase family DNA binding protein
VSTADIPRLVLRPGEVAIALGISRSKAYELIAVGAIPSLRVGSSVRVPVDALQQWIAQQTTGAAQRLLDGGRR